MAGLRYWPRGPVNGLNILEAAGGPGLSAEALLGTGADAVGFDTGVAMVDLERDRWGSETSIDQARRLVVIPAGDFDAAVCVLPIHHVADRRAAFSELYRVARPGGVLIVSTQHPSTEWLRYAASCFDTARKPIPGGCTTVISTCASGGNHCPHYGQLRPPGPSPCTIWCPTNKDVTRRRVDSPVSCVENSGE